MALPYMMSGSAQDIMSSSMAHSAQSGLDSMTFVSLKPISSSLPKPKQSWFDFVYDDEDTVMNEIDEFYSYIEMPQVAENLKAWEGSFPSDWTKARHAQRKAHVDLLLESLEHRDPEIRFTNARRLFYVLQGTFSETVSPEHQLHWIFENCKLVRSANGVSTIVEAMKIASSKHDVLTNLSESDAAHLHISATEKADFIEEVLTEIYVYLGMLYHLIEVFKGHDDFADELMSLDPPLPVYLFNVVSGLRDRSAKGYPIKKLLLVLWKTLLACFGGIRDYARVKKLARELIDLPSITDSADRIKASPLDIEAFRQETSIKYPTFTPLQNPVPALQLPLDGQSHKMNNMPLITSRLAQAYSPIPVRHHYHHDDSESGNPSALNQIQPQGSGFRQIPQPPTPAPTPPPAPAPKPKKQQFQTDQSKPFLFPFSKGQFGADAQYVPFAINEADRLYSKHIYVSLALAQMWRTREDCINAESGLEHISGEGDYSSMYTSVDPEVAEPLPDVALLNKQIDEASRLISDAESGAEKRKAKERKTDLMRLKRVEQVYNAILPTMSNWVLVLLKLLLAIVQASTGQQPPQSSTSSVFPPGVSSPPEPAPFIPPTLDELDVTRHREIMSKAVSAILLLVLKWFKVSHVMKFHHVGQLLLDSNCLLLLLKLFGLQEVSVSVVSKADSADNDFFRYCLLHFSKNPQTSQLEDNAPRAPRHTVVKTTILPNGEKHEEEVEHITEYSWRNFFSTINFAKIMQKLSKDRSHRIWMLVQYKSSAVLKRVLRVMHPMLQLHILKLIKSQVPFCGRKWRQSNMKVITSIYLNCRPDLRDEWLTANEGDDPTEAQTQEQALRHLVKFYVNRRYGAAATTGLHAHHHKRSGSMSHQLEGLHPGPELSNLIRPLGTPNVSDSDVFPPVRSQAPDPFIFLPYMTEDIAFEEEYEEYLSDLGWEDTRNSDGAQFSGGGTSAWSRLPFMTDFADNISDSESVVSIGDLGDDARLDLSREEREVVDENLNNWEHLSPKTMAALPKSPVGGRRSSSGSGLRPVLPFGLDDENPVDVDDEIDLPMGPAPRDKLNPFASGAGVDEVEYAYGV